MQVGHDSLNTRRELVVGDHKYLYYDLHALHKEGVGDVSQLPFSLKILLENLLRFEDGQSVTIADIQALLGWLSQRRANQEIAFRPARVLMQDFTGVPAVVDLATMRQAMQAKQGTSQAINPLIPVDLVIDHSVMVDHFGDTAAFRDNVMFEMERNQERYQFLKWGQQAFSNFRVVPPGTGICHQVNLEYLAQTVWQCKVGQAHYLYPDTLVGTDSHTTMINGLGVLGWGVGGIEAEAAMLGQPISMLIPEVVGFELTGKLQEGITATDLVLTVTQLLRQEGVVGKFVEFYGAGLNHLPLADRATIANMAPEYGATCGFFPIDQETLTYLQLSGRSAETIALVEAYAKTQGLWRADDATAPLYSRQLSLDLATVEPCLAGPKRPQDKVALKQAAQTMQATLELAGQASARTVKVEDYELTDGDVVIAAITSCTNTSNPAVMLGAGLVAKKALEKGMTVKPWVKTSLAPGSKVVSEYLAASGLQTALDQLGFNLVGYGCTTCIGNSGPLPAPISQAIQQADLHVCSVLSGNRNFEGRVHPQVKANWLASPPLVVAYALAGTLRINLTTDPIGEDNQGKPVYLKDIWPTQHEIQQLQVHVLQSQFHQEYQAVFDGTKEWQQLSVPTGEIFSWDDDSTYIRHPPFFEGQYAIPQQSDIEGARVLALLGDSVTTDHISPAGVIKPDSPAGEYLQSQGIEPKNFNSYGSRRGNHEVMMRGTFANIRIRNEMVPGIEGGYTLDVITGEQQPIYDAAMRYQSRGIPLVIIAGKEYGTGSSRDWAAKGTRLLGVKAVIAESFERIHRSNLIGMGVLPLQFEQGVSRTSLQLTGEETISITGIKAGLSPQQILAVVISSPDQSIETINVRSRIDTLDELHYYQQGGILHYVLANLTDDL
ncbi:aconitate hydratase AcnA [Endozoicomonas sp. SM1973]|uniref:Aconitate hydratase n=1 Tax=Spartinivicinus marinus TaxID=2994442 RepID=A0A853HZP7_9GAMM|nr:aconitate hydratase AcnA [Spartinivicinus marinus]MCX4029263.1 aconitate hydratase AcnA [Spartinivicinus marinus]NYZ65829.1 aconitate hydratase AcnA [Spartinivicinus marinus]